MPDQQRNDNEQQEINMINRWKAQSVCARAADPATVCGRTLLCVTLASIICWYIPYIAFLLYPFRLMVAYIHAGSQVIVSLLTGGHLHPVYIYADGHSRNMISSGNLLVVNSAGYIGATLFGALLLSLWNRGTSARGLLLATAALVGFVTLGTVWPWVCFFGFCWGIVLSASLLFAALYLPESAANWLLGFLGVQCVLNALFDLNTLFRISWLRTPCMGTDPGRMAAATHIPATLWAIIWIGVSLAILVNLLWPLLRSAAKQSLP